MLYQKARELKERYWVTWDDVLAILRGAKRPPTQVVDTGSGVQSTLDDVVGRVKSLEKKVGELEKHYTDLTATNTRLNSVVNMLGIGLDRRFSFRENRCVCIDGDGFRKAFYWRGPLKGYKMKKVVEGSEERYYINVKEYKWVCDPCPRYIPKHFVDTLEHLKLRLELLESQAGQLQQVVSQ